MRPILIAFIAACLPLGAYAQLAWTPPPSARQTEPVATMPPQSQTKDQVKDQAATAKAKDALAANNPDPSTEETPLCASPAVSAWNPASTGKGAICRPTQWAVVTSAGRG